MPAAPLAPVFMYGLPLVLILTVGLLGRTRRLGFWGSVIFSLILTPIGGLIVALISGPKHIPFESKHDRVQKRA